MSRGKTCCICDTHYGEWEIEKNFDRYGVANHLYSYCKKEGCKYGFHERQYARVKANRNKIPKADIARAMCNKLIKDKENE